MAMSKSTCEEEIIFHDVDMVIVMTYLTREGHTVYGW